MVNNSLRNELLAFFIESAPEMGAIALKYYQKTGLKDSLVSKKQGHINDPVTVADREISEFIVPLVNSNYGNNVILITEESPYDPNSNFMIRRPIIIIDELDGTKNFSKGKEYFSILFGLAEHINGSYKMTVGLVYKPLTEEFYFTTIDSDAIHRTKQGKYDTKLKVSDRDKMIVGVSPVNAILDEDTFPYGHLDKYSKVIEVIESFKNENRESVNIHNKQSCGLEVIDVAKGKVDAYLIPKAANWDYAAASLILQQAGGKAYLAKNLEQLLTKPVPWHLQLDDPKEYYPAFFTNEKIDKSLFGYLRKFKK